MSESVRPDFEPIPLSDLSGRIAAWSWASVQSVQKV